VESQVRPSDLTDRRIANAMLEVAREAYLPEGLQGVAYSDGELSLGSIAGVATHRQLLSPRTIAQMIQSLDLSPQSIVLLVGAGCGYEAALLANIAQTVVGVESDKGLLSWADAALQKQDIGNAVVVEGELEAGYAGEGPYDAIMINGGVDEVGNGLLDQLKDGGSLVAVRRHGGVTRVALWQRVGEQYPMREQMTAAASVLGAFKKEASFVF
jgi:protein-L-isoaspartate(D-aspartate) O-methyltransferase